MELAAVHAEADESRRRAETALAEARAAERRLAEGLAASQSAVEAQLSHLSSEYEHIIATLMERHGESAGVGGGGGEGRQVEGAASVPAASAAAVAASAAAAAEAVDAIATPSKVLGTAAAATAAAVRSAGLPSRRSVTPSSTRLSLGEWMAGTSSGAAEDDPSAVPSALVVEVEGPGAVPGIIPGRPGSARPGAPYRAPPPPDPDGGFPTPFSPSPSLASRSLVRSLVRGNENPSAAVAGGAPNMAPSEAGAAGTAGVPVSAGVGRVSPAMETARLWSHIKEMESELSALELAHKREASEASHLRFRLSLLDETHSELEELYDLSEQV
jgi:hypothetical protein